jgi:transposase
VIIDLTAVRAGTGPARLLDMVEGRSKQVFKTWLVGRPQAWRARIEVVAMDEFTGFKTAAAEELPDAVAVKDPFHVARLAGDALDLCRRRVQQARHGHRGRNGDPLYNAAGPCTPEPTCSPTSRLLDSGSCSRAMLTSRSRQPGGLTYQRMIAAYREPDRARGRELMVQLIESLSQGVPAALTEVITLGRT